MTIKHATIPAPSAVGKVGYNEWAEDHEITGNVEVPGVLRVLADADGGWFDIIGQIIPAPLGPSNPTWTQIDTGSPFYAYAFGVNDFVNIVFHMPHFYASSQGTAPTPIFLHAHWFTDGTNTQPVKWQFTYTWAKGFNQGNFNTTGTAITCEEAAAGTAYRHMVTETSAITNADFEVDGLLLVQLKRITNGGTENTDAVFLALADAHIQVDTFSTKNRAPDFYA